MSSLHLSLYPAKTRSYNIKAQTAATLFYSWWFHSSFECQYEVTLLGLTKGHSWAKIFKCYNDPDCSALDRSDYSEGTQEFSAPVTSASTTNYGWVNIPAWMLLRDMCFHSSKSTAMIWFMVICVCVFPCWAVHPSVTETKKAIFWRAVEQRQGSTFLNFWLKSCRVFCWEALEITCSS